MAISDLEKVEVRSRAELRKWLEANHESADSCWLVTYKKHVADHYLSYGTIVDELLCFGWIDSRTRRVDDDRTMLLIAPRKTGSTWSRVNKRKVASLEKAGRMTDAGREKIEAARQDGSWEFLDDVEALIEPDDLAAALDGNSKARKHFDAFNASAKKVILLWIKTAKREATRKKRIRKTVKLAARNIKAAHGQ
jgi:uncharacterized protein YdeI (YjbR/CyaY-like superfamily)